ncbi:MAG TPA: hypothetical protein VFM07_07605 [Intrasporangium sp.]|nr:hypothetical protein [Intrasporangium sp.]
MALNRRALVAVAAAVVAAAVMGSPPAGAADSSGAPAPGANNGRSVGTPMAHRDHLDAVRAATDAFHDLSAARAAGYEVEVADLAGLTCIADPHGRGGMGVHQLDPMRLTDGRIEATSPEAVIYAPGSSGPELVAVEYLVLADAWHASHRQPPRLFGQQFELVPAGNRYGLPDFYELHAWVWKANANGLFADWNPAVHCG